MKLKNFTTMKNAPFGKATKMSMFSLLLLLLTFGQAEAQDCPLGCNNSVQISLNDMCEVLLTPDMILEGEQDPACNYSVVILGANGQPISTDSIETATVTKAHIGMTLTVEVRLGSNKCWGKITVEDKLPPVIECEPLMDTINCYQMFDPNLRSNMPTAIENCDDVTVSLVSDEILDLDCSEESGGMSAVRILQYQAVDRAGNLSEICTRRLYYERIGLEDIVFPANLDDVDEDALLCTNDPVWDLDGDGYPDPDETGVPYTTDSLVLANNNAEAEAADNDTNDSDDTPVTSAILGVPSNAIVIFTENEDAPVKTYCELNVTYSDTRLDICSSSFKILREWSVLDWCTGEIAKEYQIIKILDKQIDFVTCPVDQVTGALEAISADPYTCTADWEVIPPIVSDVCNENWTYEVAYLLADAFGDPPKDGIYIQDNVYEDPNVPQKYTIRNLPCGRTWIRYTVKDDCGNVEFCFTEIDVLDRTPPEAVCDEFTVATLTSNGYARVFAKSFDDGSHDNCSETVHFEVRRMTRGCGQSTTAWGEYVEFCCDDIGKEIMVEMRVWDDGNKTGEFNDRRRYGYFDSNNNGIYGDDGDEPAYQYDNSNSCMVVVHVQDKLDPIINCPPDITLECSVDINNHDITGRPTYSDNCEVESVEPRDRNSLNKCNVTEPNRPIIRTWTVTDVYGNTATCSHRITVVNSDPFTGANNVDTRDLKWPKHIELPGCGDSDTSPDVTGRPQYDDDECSQIAETYEDQTFTFVDSACLKILRRWTVIDWCQYDDRNPQTSGGIWYYTQVIKLSNSDAPVFDNCEDLTIDAFGQNCDEDIELIAAATDECTPEDKLEYTYRIDFDDDGSKEPLVRSKDASGVYPVGVHRIYWTVEDMCGNISRCEQVLTVQDKKKPTPYCLGEVTTVIMPSSGEIEIWARDFDLGSTDNCTPQSELLFTFDSAHPIKSQLDKEHYFKGLGRRATANEYRLGTAQKWLPSSKSSAKLFACKDVGLVTVDVTVVDEFYNLDFCTSRLNVQSNGDCGGSLVSGSVHNSIYDAVADVEVKLENMKNGESIEFMTKEDGTYQFAEVPANSDYQLTANKNTDVRNGVNTLDIVLIQRHILKLQELDSPYKVIAADANNDGRVKASDLLELRKLILGLNKEFTRNTSWRFVDARQEFVNPKSPFPFAEKIDIKDYNNTNERFEFMAVKVGDVDMSSQPGLRGKESTTRSNKSVELSLLDVNYAAGDVVRVPVTMHEAGDMIGMQMSLKTAGLKLESVESNGIVLSDELVAQREDELLLSWNTTEGVAFDKDAPLFTLTFVAERAGNVARAIEVKSSDVSTEAYTADLETVNLGINFRSEKVEGGFTLMQNTPNPFVQQTTIGFTLPEAGKASLKVYDLTGKVLTTITDTYVKGYNEVSIDTDVLDYTGVMYYQLEYNGVQATKKMISINK